MNEVYPILPICNALAIILVLSPVSWHWEARNTGTLLYIGWNVLGNLNLMINTILWRETWEDLAPTWCTISAKIIIAQSAGLTAASLCINRKLYNIATIQNVSVDPKSKKRNMVVDMCLGILLPIIVVGLHYVVQPTRYQIIENIGCWPTSLNTPLTIPLVMMWPILTSAASFIYCALAIRGFLGARRRFNEVLKSSGSGITTNHYFRLMAVASGEMLFALPFAIFILRQNLKMVRQVPWVSWDYAHQGFNSVIYSTPWNLMKEDKMGFHAVLVSLWILPGGGFMFFIWFGLSWKALDIFKKRFYGLFTQWGIEPGTKVVPSSILQNPSLRNISAVPTRGHIRFSPLSTLDESA